MKKGFYLIPLLIAAFIFPKQFNAQKPDAFKPSGKVWGYAFGDAMYKAHSDSLMRGSLQYSKMPQDSGGFEFRRIYLGYDYNISEKFTSQVLLSYEGDVTASGNRTVFMKAAWLKWNICKRTDLIFGLSSTPAFSNTSEKVWGYRSVEKTILDQRGVVGSVDMGIALSGKLDSLGNYGYHVMIGNGTGARLETNDFKRFYGDIWAKFMDQKIMVDLYADFQRASLTPIGHHKNRSVMKVFVGYQTTPFTVGVEVFQQMQKNEGAIALDTLGNVEFIDIDRMGVSLFARGVLIKDKADEKQAKLSAFARYDMFNPFVDYDHDADYTGSAPSTDEAFITAGLDFAPIPNVRIIPNIWFNAYASKHPDATGKLKADNDMVGRLTVYYIFR